MAGTKNKDELLSNAEDNSINYNVLQDLCTNNASFFATDSSENGQRLYISFLSIKENIELVWPRTIRIRERVIAFDFDENTLGNGYRSFLQIVDAAITYGIQLNKKVCLKRENTFFRKNHIAKDMDSYAQLIASLDTCLKHLETMLSWSSSDCIFPKEEFCPQNLLAQYEDINQFCFYGRSLGFQFCDSLKSVLQFISMSMAVFSEFYYSQGSFITKATTSVVSSSKYVHDPEQRAKRIVNISQNADIDFCKAFWFLAESELMCAMPSVVSSSVAVSKIISLPPESFTLQVNGKNINVPVPNSHIGKKSVQVRLISYEVHDNMIGEAGNKSKPLPPARGLLIHCHGGGFVAQSSLSHECYLREWAKQLRVPILSIDYSLAPEAPFPRALEEVTYVYCWALKNLNLLGTTGERIVAAGDSAGANLLLSMTLKCVHLGIPLPMGLFVAYVPTIINFMPSPARLLCMMDPLLPFGFLMRCLKAYACPDSSRINQNYSNETSDTESFEEISESDLIELQAHKSPVSETSDTLTYGSFISNDDVDGNDASQKYVADFLEKYVLDSDNEVDGTKNPILTQENATSSQSFDYSLQSRLTNFMTSLKWRVGNWVSQNTDFKRKTNAEKYLDIDRKTTFLNEFQFVIPKDPYLSPYYASDHDLRHFPPVHVLSVHFDPCLDDCVMFAKKLKRLGNDVKLDILPGLPHGFLNFSLLSKEAYEGSKVCIDRIKNLLNLDGLPEQ